MSFFKCNKPVSLVIGTFDGVHLGHKKILDQAKKKGFAVAITFEEPPVNFFNPKQRVKILTSPLQKHHLLLKHGIDLPIIVPFDKKIASQNFVTFLSFLHGLFRFEHLTLGEDAISGKYPGGNKPAVVGLANELGFELEYIEKRHYQNEAISSSRIREAILNMDFDLVNQMM